VSILSRKRDCCNPERASRLALPCILIEKVFDTRRQVFDSERFDQKCSGLDLREHLLELGLIDLERGHETDIFHGISFQFSKLYYSILRSILASASFRIIEGKEDVRETGFSIAFEPEG
jgi:hypothetical protein